MDARALSAKREALAEKLDVDLGPFDARHLRALREVPRERFVQPGDEDLSADDVPLPLDASGLSTISAPHAYLLSLRLADVKMGDRVVELGSGTGYGAALLASIVGFEGRVLTFEIDEALAARARELLASLPNVTVRTGDAMASAPEWEDKTKIICAFAVTRIPDAWTNAIPEGGVLVAPVGPPKQQRLVQVVRESGKVKVTDHGGVRYVGNRSPT